MAQANASLSDLLRSYLSENPAASTQEDLTARAAALARKRQRRDGHDPSPAAQAASGRVLDWAAFTADVPKKDVAKFNRESATIRPVFDQFMQTVQEILGGSNSGGTLCTTRIDLMQMHRKPFLLVVQLISCLLDSCCI